MKEREDKKELDNETSSMGGRPSTAATTTVSQAVDKAPNLKEIKEMDKKRNTGVLAQTIQDEFTNFMSGHVTKNNTKSLPGTANHARDEAYRRKILNQIKHGEDEDEFEPEVTDIANFVQK